MLAQLIAAANPARRRAIELYAASLRDVLTQSGLTRLLGQLTAGQIQQLQRYLDAAVIDPAVTQEANAIYRKGTIVNGQIAYTPPEIQQQIDKVMRQYIPINQLDDAVRIDLSKVLDPKALAPITDNPDEADYLDAVRQRLDSAGVWLRIAPTFVHNPDDPSQWINDGRHFEAALTFGPHGDVIPAKNGLIDRAALLSTEIIGAQYWTKVDNGRIMTALNRQMQLVSSQIDDGMNLHLIMTQIRGQAAPGVVGISDALGGASFPSIEMWEGPSRLLVSAMTLRNAGRVWGANLLLTLDATWVRNAANTLNAFVDKTEAGAGLSVKALKVARTAGEVAGVGLAIATGVGAVAGAAGASGAAAGDAAVVSQLGRNMEGYFARNPDVGRELAMMKAVPAPGGAGAISRGVQRSLQGVGEGFQQWP